jgi:signal transduction histidine kinase
MRLSDFILSNLDPILGEFEQFARSHTTAGVDMDLRALRDHAEGMLAAVALDLEQPQTDAEQTRKSRGDAPDAGAAMTAAEQHGTDRAVSGFTLDEMFAEYRALRASVLRLWTAERGSLKGTDIQDMMRFNEAIDQALSESITRYSTSIDHSREMFLAVLGHDLRTPLSAIVSAAGFLEDTIEGDDRQLRMATMIRSSSERMTRLVGDLLDFTLSRLGRGIPLDRAPVDVGDLARATIEEIGAMHPDRELRFESEGDLQGEWDADRIRQVLGNVIGNAVQHGGADNPIVVRAAGDGDAVTLEISNSGPPMPSEARQHIFDPFKRLAPDDTAGSDRRSMGLGLYIAQQIMSAHGGSIEVASSASSGTRFTLRLPRGR